MNEKDLLFSSLFKLIPETSSQIFSNSGELDSYHMSNTRRDILSSKDKMSDLYRIEISDSCDKSLTERRSDPHVTESLISNDCAKSSMEVSDYCTGEIPDFRYKSKSICGKRSQNSKILSSVENVSYSSNRCLTGKRSNHNIIESLIKISKLEDTSSMNQKLNHCRVLISKCGNESVIRGKSNCRVKDSSTEMFESFKKSAKNEIYSHTLNFFNSGNTSLTGERSNHHHYFESCRNHLEAIHKELKVPVLESLESLKEKCRDLGLKLNDYIIRDEVIDKNFEDFESNSGDSAMTEETYEVDLIFSHMISDDEPYYYVKWKNFTCDNSTWEPEYNLNGCQQAIKYYHAMENSESKFNKFLLRYFVRDLTTRKPYDILTLRKVCALCYNYSENDIISLQLTVPQMKKKVNEILKFSSNRIEKINKELFPIMRYGEARKKVLINLKEWENEINLKNKTAYIKVENNVDLETAPPEFKFIQDYISTIVNISEEPVTFCQCKNCYNNKESCCPVDSDGSFSYNRYGRLILKPGYPIYECNKRCACDSSCANRVVQHGQKKKVCIFRTSNGCGWGLKSLQSINEGEFLCEYLGEIISSEAAEERGKVYDYVARSYLFDLDYGIDSCCYTVDAGHVGNVSHFINHSCDPNLHVFAVWINQPDPNLPRIALFAKKKISIGEELTFDYQMVQRDRFGSQSPLPENERVLCLCKSENCRKFLF